MTQYGLERWLLNWGRCSLKDTIQTVISVFRVENCLRYMPHIGVLLSFGVADGITGAYMMEKIGADFEINPVAKYLFLNQGFWAVVIYKVLYTCMILIAIYLVGRLVELRLHKNTYWVVNGILAAYAIGGAMAATSNLIAVRGGIPSAPDEIIFLFVIAVFGFIGIGNELDRNQNHCV